MEPIIWMNLSGVYELEDFYKNNHFQWKEIDLKDLQNTNCYIDEEAKAKIRSKIADCQERIHYIDSGNYHYLSLLWMEKIQEDFALVLLDEHPDMQMPSFGPITSCGAWVREALEKLPHLKRVYHIGADSQLMKEVLLEWRKDLEAEKEKLGMAGMSDQVVAMAIESTEDMPRPDLHFMAQSKISVISQENNNVDYWKKIWEVEKLPIYVSIDKDVMGRMETPCDWSQGIMKFRELEHFLVTLPAQNRLLGLDVCGEESPANYPDAQINEQVNLDLARYLEYAVGKDERKVF